MSVQYFYFIIMIKTLNYVQFNTKHNTLTNSLRLSDTLGPILLITHKINRDRAQMLWGLMQGGVGGAPRCGERCLCKGCGKTQAERYFRFSPLPTKVETHLEFLS